MVYSNVPQSVTPPIESRVIVTTNTRSAEQEEGTDIDSFVESLEVEFGLKEELAAARQWVAETYASAFTSLKQARLAKGLSQKDLAEKVGLKQPNISAIESGLRRPNFDTAKKIGAVLDLSAEQVYSAITSREAV